MKKFLFQACVIINLLTVCGAASAAEQAAPQPGGGLGLAALKLVFGLAAVIGLMLGALYVFKKYMASKGLAVGNERFLKVAAAVPVGMKSNVVLLDFMDSYLLVGVADGAITLLSRFEKAPGEKAAQAAGAVFEEELSKSLDVRAEKAGKAYMEAASAALAEETGETKPTARRRGRPPKAQARRPVLTPAAAPVPVMQPLPAVALVLKQKLERIRAAI